MRITIGTQKYWVYWNYKKILRSSGKKKGTVRNIETTCYIVDDNIRGKIVVLTKSTIKKYESTAHCRPFARAYSLQEAIENLFPDDLESQHRFAEEAFASGVNFMPKQGKTKKSISI